MADASAVKIKTLQSEHFKEEISRSREQRTAPRLPPGKEFQWEKLFSITFLVSI